MVKLTTSISLNVGTFFSNSSFICAIKDADNIFSEYIAKSISETLSSSFLAKEPKRNKI